MIAKPHDHSADLRDAKAVTLKCIGAPYMPLLTFLREAPPENVRRWVPAAPPYKPDFWNRYNGRGVRCLSYAFNQLWRGVNIDGLRLKRHWDVANPPAQAQTILDRYGKLQRDIEYQLVQSCLSGVTMGMPEWANSKVDNLREVLAHILSYGLTLVEKPGDLNADHHLIGLGLLPQKYVDRNDPDFLPAEHFARLDANGFWSEKYGAHNVISSNSSDPLSLNTWAAPTCFFQFPAHNKP